MSATYYTANAAVPACTGVNAGTTFCGHPDDAIGWAIEFGAEIKLPQFGPQDRFGFGLRYAQGASGFGQGSNLNGAQLYGSGNTIAYGIGI